MVEIFRIADGELVAEADVHFRRKAIANTDETFGFEISLVVAVERCGASQFEVEVD